jgi:MFS family permease
MLSIPSLNNSNYLLATSGGFIQAFLYGLIGLRIEAQGLVGEFPATLPKELAYLKLVNVVFRGQAFDVAVSRLPSGQDVVIPKLRGLFTLTYGEVMLVQSAFFAAYFVLSIPAAWIVRRVGYMRTAVIGLLLMTAGCLLFVPASSSGLFVTFLAALFVLAAGITVVQVVANPLISMLGPAATAHSRLTFAQAFNSLGTTIFPYVGSILILGSLAKVDPTQLAGPALATFRTQETHVVVRTYLGLASVLVLVAALVWLRRNRLVEAAVEDISIRHPLDLLRQRRFGFGALCIFLYCQRRADAACTKEFAARAAARHAAIDRYLWDASSGAYFDYRWTHQAHGTQLSAATLYPLFVALASKSQATSVAKIITRDLLKRGGVVTTTLDTGQQWDAPNGWAPLQWIAIGGLRRYGSAPLAATIACRWMTNVNEVYRRGGKLVEKYDVIHTGRSGGGGEYPTQDGFGWTNGVMRKLIALYPADAAYSRFDQCPKE